MNFDVNASVKMEYKDCAVVLNDIHDQAEPKRNGNNNNDPPSSTYVNGQLQSTEIKREPIEETIPNGRGGESDAGNDDGTDDDDDGEFVFEYEEAERPLPPLYLLKDEAAADKWVLMTDLCNILKLRSKEAVMRQICSNATPVNSINQTTNTNSTGPVVNTPTANNTTNTTTASATSNGTTTNGSTTANSNRELIRELKLEDFLSRASCLQLLYAGEKLNINSNKVVLVKYNENVRNLLQVQTLVTKI